MTGLLHLPALRAALDARCGVSAPSDDLGEDTAGGTCDDVICESAHFFLDKPQWTAMG